MNMNKITAEEFDELFDNGESILEYADLSTARRPNKNKRVNVDFPFWLVEALDKEAERRGVTRQSLIKMWLCDRIEQANCVKAM